MIRAYFAFQANVVTRSDFSDSYVNPVNIGEKSQLRYILFIHDFNLGNLVGSSLPNFVPIHLPSISLFLPLSSLQVAFFIHA